jgi:hypothetical protein
MKTHLIADGPRPLSAEPSMTGFSIGLLALCAALFFGAVASTGDPLTIGMSFGAVGGAFLAAMPGLVVVMSIVGGLAAGVVISLAGPAFTPLSWVISLLTFALMPLSLLTLAKSRTAPLFVWVVLAFMLGSLLISVMHWHSLQELTAGSKRYFQGYGVIFALALLSFTQKRTDHWKRLIVYIAFLQLPFAVYEFFVLVPLRGGLEAGGEATDVVAGTFGANLIGGSPNAEMSAFLLVVAGFVVAYWRAGLIATKRFLGIVLLCLAPLAFGETKIVVVLLPVLGFVLLRKDLMRNPFKYLPSVVVCSVLTIALGYIYISVMDRSSFDDTLEATAGYNVGARGYGGLLLNRSTVLSFWWDHHELASPGELFFGHGLGSSFWGDNSPLPGHVAMRYPGYGIDLTTASTLLWDIGITGLLGYIAVFLAAWSDANRLWRSTSDPAVRADALAIQAAISIFLIFICYRNSGVNLLGFQIVVGMVLGYLAYLLKTAPMLPAVASSDVPGSKNLAATAP